MRLKLAVRIASLVSLVIVSAITAIYIAGIELAKRTENKGHVVEKIVEVTNEQRSVGINYLLFHEANLIIRWQALQDETVELLQSPEFNSPEEQSILEDMRENNVKKTQAFSKFVTNFGRSKNSRANIQFKNPEAVYVVKIIDLANLIVSGALSLSKINAQKQSSAHNRNTLASILSTAVLAALNLALLVGLEFRIVRRFEKLISSLDLLATANWTKKDWSHSLDQASRDEFGQVANSFNSMAMRLRASFLNLEGEIAKRRSREQDLIQANLTLARQKQDLEQFAAAAVHDLRTPLRHIVSYTQLLSRKLGQDLGETENLWMQRISDGALHTRTLLDALYTYLALGSTQEPLKSFSLEHAAKKSAALLEQEIQASNAQIQIEKLPSIVAYEDLIVELLKQLVSNALKFRRSDQTPVIQIAEERLRSSLDQWCFSVADNGVGIAPPYFEKIFQIFQRLNGADKSGVGIGLSICRKIVSIHSGRIWVESSPNRGSKFYFTLLKPSTAGLKASKVA